MERFKPLTSAEALEQAEKHVKVWREEAEKTGFAGMPGFPVFIFLIGVMHDGQRPVIAAPPDDRFLALRLAIKKFRPSGYVMCYDAHMHKGGMPGQEGHEATTDALTFVQSERMSPEVKAKAVEYQVMGKEIIWGDEIDLNRPGTTNEMNPEFLLAWHDEAGPTH